MSLIFNFNNASYNNVSKVDDKGISRLFPFFLIQRNIIARRNCLVCSYFSIFYIKTDCFSCEVSLIGSYAVNMPVIIFFNVSTFWENVRVHMGAWNLF